MKDQPPPQLGNTVYTVGWIAVLHTERAAAEALLDQRHAPPLYRHQRDINTYTLGSIRGLNGHHNVVITSLPAGRTGLQSAAMTASQMLSSFPQIKHGLLVGVGGGIPDLDNGRDIRLGDVVVGHRNPWDPDGPVRHYDSTFWTVSRYENEKATMAGYKDPSDALLSAVTVLRRRHDRVRSEIPRTLVEMCNAYPLMRNPQQGHGYVYQGEENDQLFHADYDHPSENRDCSACDTTRVIARKKRNDRGPHIFYGTIASGSLVIKDAWERDKLKKCLCFEMEAAALMNLFPCLVVRGISDYCDGHKNDRWQRYAAATAAAYAKELLQVMGVDSVDVRSPSRRPKKSSCCFM